MKDGKSFRLSNCAPALAPEPVFMRISVRNECDTNTYALTYHVSYRSILEHTHIHTRTHIHTHTHTYAHIRTHTHMHTYEHIRTCTHTNTYAHAHTRTHTNTYAHAHIRTLSHAHMHARKQVHLRVIQSQMRSDGKAQPVIIRWLRVPEPSRRMRGECEVGGCDGNMSWIA